MISIYGSKEIADLYKEYEQITSEYQQKIADAFQDYLRQNHLDKDVVCIESGKVGRLMHNKKSFSHTKREYRFYPYTKSGVLSKANRGFYMDFNDITEAFRPAVGEEIVSAD